MTLSIIFCLFLLPLSVEAKNGDVCSSPMTVLLSADFRNDITAYATYFSLWNPALNDGVVSSRNGSLDIRADKFTNTAGTGTLDHVKYFALSSAFETNATQDVVCSIRMRGWTTNTVNNPFSRQGTPVDANDARLAGATSTNVDFTTMVVADFYLTNTTIYAIYERLPFLPYPYQAFTYMVPVGTRAVTDTHDLAVRFSNAKGIITWYVGGNTVLKVDRIGMGISTNYRANKPAAAPGGFEEIVPVQSINCGLGLFTLMDFFPICNSPAGCTSLTAAQDKGLVQLNDYSSYAHPRNCSDPQFIVQNNNNNNIDMFRMFGQGAGMQAEYVKVFAVDPERPTISQ